MSGFSYLRASTLDEASTAVKAGAGKTLLKAGGVDVLDRIKEHLEAPERLVSILGVASARAIELRPDGSASIGALATMTELAEHPGLRQRFPALTAAAGGLATPAIRNAATLGGNLCQRPRCGYFRSELYPCRRKGGAECFAIVGDHRMHALYDNGLCAAVLAPSTAAPLVALRAELVVTSAGNKPRRLPAEALFVASSEDVRREVRLEPGEIIERIELPAGAWRSAYARATPRDSFDWAMVEVAVAALADKSGISDVRIVLGAVAMTPRRAVESEKLLRGKPPSRAAIEAAAQAATSGATPLPGNRYKLSVATAVVAQALSAALEGLV
jgi:xanthine dehydrogenase YagS FAD-binding subunit